MQVLACENASPGVETWTTQEADPGTYWLWVGAPVDGGVPCGSPYVMTIEGYVPAASSSVDATPQRPDSLHGDHRVGIRRGEWFSPRDRIDSPGRHH